MKSKSPKNRIKKTSFIKKNKKRALVQKKTTKKDFLSRWKSQVLFLIAIGLGALLLGIEAGIGIDFFKTKAQLSKALEVEALSQNNWLSLKEENRASKTVLFETRNAQDNPLRDWGTGEFSSQSSSVLAYDLDAEYLLFEKDLRKVLPIASITKILSAFIIKEYENNLPKWLSFEKEDLEVEGNAGIFNIKDHFKTEDLLAAALIGSNNEAISLLARTVVRAINEKQGENKVPDFVWLMNQKAQELNLKDSHFSNPIGFDGDNYSSAWDILKLSKAILKKQPDLLMESALREKTIISQELNTYRIRNTNRLLDDLGNLSSILASKTGYTDGAKGCLLMVKLYGNHRILLVILGSQDRRSEMAKLISWVDRAYQFTN